MPLAFILLPVLLPLNFRASGGAHLADGLDKFSWTNVATRNVHINWVHLGVSLLVILWVGRVICYEMQTYTRLRHQRMAAGAQNPAGNTILITDIPSDLATEEKLREIFDVYHGGVKKVWV